MPKQIQITISLPLPEGDGLDAMIMRGKTAEVLQEAKKRAIGASNPNGDGALAFRVSDPEIIEVKKPRRDKGVLRGPKQVAA